MTAPTHHPRRVDHARLERLAKTCETWAELASKAGRQVSDLKSRLARDAPEQFSRLMLEEQRRADAAKARREEARERARKTDYTVLGLRTGLPVEGPNMDRFRRIVDRNGGKLPPRFLGAPRCDAEAVLALATMRVMAGEPE